VLKVMNKKNQNAARRALLAALAIAFTARAEATELPFPGIYFADDVAGQFDSLARRGDGLAFNLGSVPDWLEPSLCKHMQGLARLPGPGTPYIFVSRSGNDPGFSCVTGFESDVPGSVFVVRMGSRETSGERMRSNRLVRGWPSPLVQTVAGPQLWTKPADSSDRLVGTVDFAGRGWPNYMHPGGMQIVDNVLAVAVEAPYLLTTTKDNAIVFIDVANPESPQLLSQWPRNGSADDVGPAGLVGLTPVLNPDGPGLRYLMITTGKDNGVVRMWRSRSTTGSPEGATDLRSPNLGWQQVGRRDYPQLEATECSGGEDWPEGRDAYQSLNFVREGNLVGPLYLVGGRNTGVAGRGDDLLGLYRVDVDDYGNPGECMLRFVSKRQLTSFPFNGHGDSASLSAAGGTHVTPSGELIVYGTEYENDGPFEQLPDGSHGLRSVRFVEWRNIDVVRPNSPTLRPSVSTQSLYEVDEGSSVTLVASASAASTKAWLQLFEDDGAGDSVPGGLGDDDWLQVDYADWSKDHFDDFRRLDATTQTDFNDNAGSLRWFAPSGCSIRANEDPVGASTGVFPGRHTRTLAGTGEPLARRNLDLVANDGNDATMDDKISSVQFGAIAGYDWPHADCNDYYAASIAVQWDLDGNSTYEASGNQVEFSAVRLDGPYQVLANVRAQHPTDVTDLGRSDPRGVPIRIRNVAPGIGVAELRDSQNNTVGVAGGSVPFVLTGLPVTVYASFTDPGRADHQTARLNWGDGTVDSQTTFLKFEDAFDGRVGSVKQSHVYLQPATRALELQVTDDDGGATSLALTVRALSPVQAVHEIGELLQALLATTTRPDVRRDLEGARMALLGSRAAPSQNGAFDMISAGQKAAADAFLATAIDRLTRAMAGGANVSNYLSLLRQVRISLSQ
jgi:hypothetical protein